MSTVFVNMPLPATSRWYWSRSYRILLRCSSFHPAIWFFLLIASLSAGLSVSYLIWAFLFLSSSLYFSSSSRNMSDISASWWIPSLVPFPRNWLSKGNLMFKNFKGISSCSIIPMYGLSLCIWCDTHRFTSICLEARKRVSLLTKTLRILCDSSSLWSSNHSPIICHLKLDSSFAEIPHEQCLFLKPTYSNGESIQIRCGENFGVNALFTNTKRHLGCSIDDHFFVIHHLCCLCGMLVDLPSITSGDVVSCNRDVTSCV